MFRKLTPIVLLLCAVHTLFGQTSTENVEKERKGRPNIPGTISVDFGLNLPFNKPSDFSLSVWGSRTVNLYYQVDKQLGSSKFSVHPGGGFGLERYNFKNDYTLSYIPGPTSPFDTLALVPTTTDTRKSQLIANYFDALVDFRYSSNPSDPARSFKVSLGIKGGFLFDSFTKIKYREDSQTKKLKDKQDWNLSPFRYAVTLRIGIGNFSIFGTYNINPIFEKGKGPGQTDFNNFTTGISLAAF